MSTYCISFLAKACAFGWFRNCSCHNNTETVLNQVVNTIFIKIGYLLLFLYINSECPKELKLYIYIARENQSRRTKRFAVWLSKTCSAKWLVIFGTHVKSGSRNVYARFDCNWIVLWPFFGRKHPPTVVLLIYRFFWLTKLT